MLEEPAQATQPKARIAEVFGVFLKLGLTSFGGPIAHLGYFRTEFVERRRWLDDGAYADLVALCQFLPGPASSQVGFALGLMRGGWWGACAAFVGFTLPSALLLLAFAQIMPLLSGPLASGALDGLKIVAVAIVAQAVLGMARNLCPERITAGIAVGAVACLAIAPGVWGMLGAIALGAVAGAALIRPEMSATGRSLDMPMTRRQGIGALVVFAAMICLLPFLADLSQMFAMLDGFVRAGALVFGGGHVVLPLLEAETVAQGWVSGDAFLAGYGAAQAVPGPLFTFATYLGAVQGPGPNGVTGALLASLAIFAPGFLILIAALPHWAQLRSQPAAQALMRGANAAVVGVLGAALYDPVFTTAIGDLADLALALACLVLLMLWRCPPWLVVLGAAGAGATLGIIT
ncbi:chromate efflux transporter [Roseicyclus sp.]|uniref:chromate efflux transporter n=1 Tax=Roseicyclus sp. TaxID=1914329 RepID=UPI003F6B764B